MDVFLKHQVQIAVKTLQMNDVGVLVMGGMTKEEARELLKKAGWKAEKIERLEKGESK